MLKIKITMVFVNSYVEYETKLLIEDGYLSSRHFYLNRGGYYLIKAIIILAK